LDTNVEISTRLREERKRLGLSQTEFAAKAKVHLKSQMNYEKGDRAPDAAYLSAIAAAGADVLYILTGERREGLDAAGVAMFETMAMAGLEDAGFLESVGKNVRNDKEHTRHREPMYKRLTALLDICSDTDVLLLTYLADRMLHGEKPTFPHSFEVDWKTGGGNGLRRRK
jgi:transcriptional regulator with XRE-family HTH domain